MIDPRAALIVLAICASIWGVQWLGHQVKVGAHKVGCGIAKVVGHPCKPYVDPPPPVFTVPDVDLPETR